jgi:hypothetical protein
VNRLVLLDVKGIQPTFNEQLKAAAYHAFPDLFMPDSVLNDTSGFEPRTFPHEKYLLWRLGVDSLEDVVRLTQTIIHWDNPPYGLSIEYKLNPGYCFEHRQYMSQTNENGEAHYYSHHDMDQEKFEDLMANW